MTVNLTPEQSAALRTGEVVQFADPQTRDLYVLVPAASYSRLQTLFAEGPLDADERRTVLQGVWRRADWDDPALDEYERLVPPKPTP